MDNFPSQQRAFQPELLTFLRQAAGLCISVSAGTVDTMVNKSRQMPRSELFADKLSLNTGVIHKRGTFLHDSSSRTLLQEKLEPTVERVRSKLGGGSFSTISRLLSDVLAARQTQATQISEVPSDLVAVGQQAVGAIYAAVQRQAAAKIEVIEANGRKHIEAANHARAEAALEIERLESEAEQLTESVAAAQSAIHDAVGRAERAEATALAARAEIDRLGHAFAAAQADAQAARESDQEAQRRAARSEDGRREAEAASRKEIDELRQALARSDAAAARASGELERIAPVLEATEKDAKELRSEREQLQLKLVKAETSIESMQKELLAVKEDRDTARENERQARDEAAEARGRLKGLGGDAGK